MITNFPVVEDSKIITKYTDYLISTPNFFIEFLQKEMPLRDLRGLTNGRIKAVNITGEHPLVLMTGAVLSAQKKVDISGFLPAISVVESDENEEFENLGYSKRTAFALDSDWVTAFKAAHGDIKTRQADGLLSDHQLEKIHQAVSNATNANNPKGALIAYIDGHMIRESVFVSVWVESVDERNIIGNTVRSVIYDMRKEMVNRTVKDIHIRSSKGLVNTNFGRVLKGQETTLDFINVFHTITVSMDIPSEFLLDSTNNITVYDTQQEAYVEINANLNVNAEYVGEGTNDDHIDQAGNEI